MSIDDWDDFENEVNEIISNLQNKPEEIPETPVTVVVETTVLTEAEKKRRASIEARARESAILEEERQARNAIKAAKKAEKEKAEREEREARQRIIDNMTPYELFLQDFVEKRRKELIKKNGGRGNGFRDRVDKNQNPTRGPDYEKAVQDANAAWKEMQREKK